VWKLTCLLRRDVVFGTRSGEIEISKKGGIKAPICAENTNRGNQRRKNHHASLLEGTCHDTEEVFLKEETFKTDTSTETMGLPRRRI